MRMKQRPPGRRPAMPRLARTAMACMVSLGLTGCVLNTEHPDAMLDVPAKYGNAPRAAKAAEPRPEWWRGFGSPELTGLVE